MILKKVEIMRNWKKKEMHRKWKNINICQDNNLLDDTLNNIINNNCRLMIIYLNIVLDNAHNSKLQNATKMKKLLIILLKNTLNCLIGWSFFWKLWEAYFHPPLWLTTSMPVSTEKQRPSEGLAKTKKSQKCFAILAEINKIMSILVRFAA